MPADIVVDSSVWVDFFNKKTSPQIEKVKSFLLNNTTKSPFIILPVIMQEILQGIEDQKFYIIIKENLYGLEFFNYDAFGLAVQAAELYRFLRKKGVTIRKSNDCLIASVCIAHNFRIIHSDKDFDQIAKYTSLKIYK
ncbi:MAG TPA: PIN domain-containing protein [Chitinophagaceae bacterium]|nr:PIN domain-containing protein [Chitinophagaceae bacterium]